eukprot:TRINITY_DN18161_c0_g1_i1.p1 TRINITY_DN18161_c0_g1~~TRINITY_DN18161_c0_g1_i1.p1  ORF type:complete len:249 (+),score=69.95 TRINITY_DN18161_c0_g1_i1:52-747(+)
MAFRPAYASTFFGGMLTAYGSAYALGVHYERSPDTLKYYKPILFGDNSLARYTDMYLPPLFVGSMVCINQWEWLRNSAMLGPLFYPVARTFGTSFAMLTYFAAGAVATLSWKLQSNLNPDKNITVYDRNVGSAGALCGLGGAALTIPAVSIFKTFYMPVAPIAAGFIAERAYDEYARCFFEVKENDHPHVRQWGGVWGAIFGGICGFTALRKRSGHVMKDQFTRNFGPKWK